MKVGRAYLQIYAWFLRAALWREAVPVSEMWTDPEEGIIGLVFTLPDGTKSCAAIPIETAWPTQIAREYHHLIKIGGVPEGQLLALDPSTGQQEILPMPVAAMTLDREAMGRFVVRAGR